jgi:hypothetical protein
MWYVCYGDCCDGHLHGHGSPEDSYPGYQKRFAVCPPTDVPDAGMTILEKNRNPTVENSLFRVMLTTLAGKKAM